MIQMITYKNPYKVDGEGSDPPYSWNTATEYEDDGDKISYLASEISKLKIYEIKELQLLLRNKYNIELILK